MEFFAHNINPDKRITTVRASKDNIHYQYSFTTDQLASFPVDELEGAFLERFREVIGEAYGLGGTYTGKLEGTRFYVIQED